MKGSIVHLSGEEDGSRSLCLHFSLDLAKIDCEKAKVLSQSECLIRLKRKTEKLPTTTNSPTRDAPLEKESFPKLKTKNSEWIPTRDTLLSSSRKNAIRPSSATTAQKTKKHWRLSKSAQSPAILHTRQFYLNGGSDKAKGQTIFLDASVKPPPIIPSCLKVPKEEEKLESAEWLKRNGLCGLKINLSRWERRITHGSKVYRGVLPVVRDRHCELQIHELEQLENLSIDAARRYLRSKNKMDPLDLI